MKRDNIFEQILKDIQEKMFKNGIKELKRREAAKLIVFYRFSKEQSYKLLEEMNKRGLLIKMHKQKEIVPEFISLPEEEEK
ncbi:MAG: hypothetical protein JSW08_00435 [archaeon]|nr:MAG: hypothetical protein JSW08_00435 [archaeon]